MTENARLGADAISDDERVVLCVPRAGTNDVLCRIQECWAYAEKYNRTLIIDSTKSGLLGPFPEFFSFKPSKLKIIEQVDADLMKKLNSFACSPAPFEGRLDTYTANYVPEVGNYCEIAIGVQIAFDRDRDHDEQLLLYEQSGGGGGSVGLLPKITLSPKIMPLVCERLANLPSDYIAVHVRNTDYRTNYGRFFFDIYPRTVGRNLLICSDDHEVIQKAKKVFVHANVMTVTETPNIGKTPLHRPTSYESDADRRMATINSITDLLALGGADELYFHQVTDGFHSGFSMLANALFENKSRIESLLGGRTLKSIRTRERQEKRFFRLPAILRKKRDS